MMVQRQARNRENVRACPSSPHSPSNAVRPGPADESGWVGPIDTWEAKYSSKARDGAPGPLGGQPLVAACPARVTLKILFV